MNTKNLQMLAEGNMTKTLLKLCLPSVAAMAITGVYNIVDAYFIGRMGSTDAVGALSVLFPLLMILTAVGSGISVGAGSLVSRLLGGCEQEKAQKAVAAAMILALAAGVLFTVFGIVFAKPLLRLLGASDAILPFALKYTRWFLSGSVFVMADIVLAGTIRAEGNALYPTIALLSGTVLNIVLDPLFIFSLQLGITGAAIATVFSYIVTFGLLLAYYTSKRSAVSLKKIAFSSLNKQNTIETIAVGVPVLMKQTLTAVGFAIVNAFIAPYGAAALAASGICTKINSFVIVIIIGMTQGFMPVAGFNYGAKNHKRVIESVKVALMMSLVFSIVCIVFYLFFGGGLVSLFSTDVAVIALGTTFMQAFSTCILFNAAAFMIESLYLAAGKARVSLLFSFSRLFLLLPLVFVLSSIFKQNGIIYAMPAADILFCVGIAMPLYVHFIRSLKRETVLSISIESPQAAQGS